MSNPSDKDLEGTLVDKLCGLSWAANRCTRVLKDADEAEIVVRPQGTAQVAVPRSCKSLFYRDSVKACEGRSITPSLLPSMRGPRGGAE